MDFAPLSTWGKTAPRIALGTWALGGGNDWGSADASDAARAVQAALDAGVNMIDTAPVYGSGRAEELTGRAVKGRRESVLIATKCGVCVKGGRPDHDLRPESIYAECDASLKRLETDYIDLYQIHWPDPKTPLADSLGALTRLKERGKIRAVGVCNFSAGQLRQACGLAQIAAVQNPFSLLSPGQDEERAFCRRANIAFLAYGVLGGGILSGKYKQMPNFRRCDARRYFYKYYFGADFDAAQAVAARVKELAAQKNAAPAAVALAWALAQSGVSGVLAGARNAAQARQNASAPGLSLSRAETEYLLHG